MFRGPQKARAAKRLASPFGSEPGPASRCSAPRRVGAARREISPAAVLASPWGAVAGPSSNTLRARRPLEEANPSLLDTFWSFLSPGGLGKDRLSHRPEWGEARLPYRPFRPLLSLKILTSAPFLVRGKGPSASPVRCRRSPAGSARPSRLPGVRRHRRAARRPGPRGRSPWL